MGKGKDSFFPYLRQAIMETNLPQNYQQEIEPSRKHGHTL